MPQTLRDLLDDLAQNSGQSLNRWLQSTLERQFNPGSIESRGIPAAKLSARYAQLSHPEAGETSTYTLRMDLELRIKLEEAAKRSNRSLNKEIINRLVSAISDEDFQKIVLVIMQKSGIQNLDEIVLENDQDESATQSAATNHALCIRLKAERKRLRRTQAEIAADCGISREVWCRYERGITLPSSKLLQAFVKAGANPEFLLTGDVSQTRLTKDEQLLLDLYRKSPEAIQAAALRVLK
jgi:transcriptional regulator with XRE-family HTH domain/predicted HicB family RNase H-like nuclease